MASQRTLEEALAGVPARKYFKNPSHKRSINPETGRVVAGRPRQKKPKPSTIQRDHTSPEAITRKFKVAAARDSAEWGKKRASVPKGYRRHQWEPIFNERLSRARIIVDKMIDSQEVPGFDDVAKERDASTDEGRALIALDYNVAVVLSKEMNAAERRQSSALVLQYCKPKPAEKRDIKVSAEDFLASLSD